MFSQIMGDPAARVFAAILLVALSGVPGLFIRTGATGQRLATAASAVAAALALPSVVTMLLARQTATYSVFWNLPFGACEVAIDPLSAYFLIPIFVVFLCGSVYANGYFPAARHGYAEARVTFFYGLLAAAMALVVIARNGALFLIAWEVMALSAYFLLVTEHEEPEVRTAGLVYLVATHIGTAALFVYFSLLNAHTGSFLFPAAGGLHLPAVAATTLFALALFGFGAKAGLMPLHIWLPAAHANAPSHVSAVLSGVMLKMGVYGILRFLSFVDAPPLWWGGLLTGMGLFSAFMGIALASSRRDIKRMLAYSSIENIGIITAGIGIAVIGQATGNARLAYLGMAGALLHVINHSLFKPLLFMGAGSVIHATGTRELDTMGGLAKNMRWTALFTLAGVVAISGLPPFNGFVSEFMLYMGFFGEAASSSTASSYLVVGAPVLAMTGGVALICFVKLYGVAFLGAPRSAQAAGSHEAPAAMLLPMAALAGACLFAGLLPQALLPLAEAAMSVPAPVSAGLGGSPVEPGWFTFAGLGLLGLAAAVAVLLGRRLSSLPSSASRTWGCGYLAPSARMQYTGTSFSEMFTTLTKGVVRASVIHTEIKGFAPKPSAFGYVPEETVIERFLVPMFNVSGSCFAFVRRVQSGRIHIYMMYFFVTLVTLMIWTR
ncbi:MAG: hydrogenase [Nitrospirae bacterium]|nr:hydrogenase [Nitrospirota bacterium]